MFRALTVLRPAVHTYAARSSAHASLRAFSTTPRALSGEHGGPPQAQVYGPGVSNSDKIPTDEEQATGLERLQVVEKMLGKSFFDMNALDASRIGTMAEPIKVPTLSPQRLIGCTGYPADSHEVLWINATIDKPRHRCSECGSVYTLVMVGGEAEAH